MPYGDPIAAGLMPERMPPSVPVAASHAAPNIIDASHQACANGGTAAGKEPKVPHRYSRLEETGVMTQKRGKTGIIIAAVSVMVLIIAAGSVATVLLVKRAQHKNDIKQADKAASAFNQRADEWKKQTVEELRDLRVSGTTGDYENVSEVVEEQQDKAPEPETAPDYGVEHSSSYAAAQKRAKTLTDGLDDITAASEVAQKQTTWATKAFTTLLDNPAKSLPTRLRKSKKLRSDVIPEYKDLLKKFRKLDTPEGAKETSKAIEDALSYAINEFSKLADHIDSNQAYSTKYSKKYKPAQKKLDSFVSSIGNDVKKAIDSFDDVTSSDST